MSVEVLAGPVVTHGRLRVGVPGSDLHVAQADPGVQHGRKEGVTQHVRMHSGHPHPGDRGEPAQSSGGGVPIHPDVAVEQDRPGHTITYRSVERPSHGRRQGDEHNLRSTSERAAVRAGQARGRRTSGERLEDQNRCGRGTGPCTWTGRPRPRPGADHQKKGEGRQNRSYTNHAARGERLGVFDRELLLAQVAVNQCHRKRDLRHSGWLRRGCYARSRSGTAVSPTAAGARPQPW